MELESYRYIAIEGPIGVGKTSLATRLATLFGAGAILEQPADNPFLEAFYRDAGRHAFQTQTFFLLQRIAQLQAPLDPALAAERFVADFMLEKNALFSQLTLAGDELQLYQALHAQLRPQVRLPDLVIYLQAPTPTLLARIAQRGIGMEEAISSDYLQQLSDSYSNFFYHYEETPVLTVNTEHLDPAHNDADLQVLLQHIEAMRGKRAFLNQGG
ncbi:deoxynucleoside kinase [Herbaspirillum sp. LeCh32-8]|uniref:deoxynucleoside kinase n=1 Tax=Herbaspirillum sp. LeCh32-8 TaxID=2821356 RepID=UPI001AE71C8D|nr:deoxynucleoside kinase [Herbaspirillum sp. LeCh32-8]MBP0600328.1 deoxynucleoside kinase [Herbaspirillum sp. LeCh32-8]